MWNKKKIYKYKTQYLNRTLVADEWSQVCRYVLRRDGFRIEVEKITEGCLATYLTIYYYYVKEQEDVAED